MVYKVITLIVILPNKMKIIKQISWRRISQSEIRNSAAAESEGGQKFLPPNPLPFCPPERSVWRAKRAVSSVQKRFGFRQTNALEQGESDLEQANCPEIVCEFLKSSYNFGIPLSSLTEIVRL